MVCDAMALAKSRGEWQDETTEAMLLGSYVHAAVEGTLEQFRQDHPECFKKNGDPYAYLAKADEMIATLEQDRMIQFVLHGEKEVPIVAQFAGAWWKAKIDVYTPDQGRFADIKTVKAIREKYWDKKYGWVTFLESFGYIRQMALYAELERRATGRAEWLEPLIVAVSKEDPPDKEIISIDEARMRMELQEVRENVPHIMRVKLGKEEPRRCERCKYCRSTKELRHVVHYMDLLAE